MFIMLIVMRISMLIMPEPTKNVRCGSAGRATPTSWRSRSGSRSPPGPAPTRPGCHPGQRARWRQSQGAAIPWPGRLALLPHSLGPYALEGERRYSDKPPGPSWPTGETPPLPEPRTRAWRGPPWSGRGRSPPSSSDPREQRWTTNRRILNHEIEPKWRGQQLPHNSIQLTLEPLPRQSGPSVYGPQARTSHADWSNQREDQTTADRDETSPKQDPSRQGKDGTEADQEWQHPTKFTGGQPTGGGGICPKARTKSSATAARGGADGPHESWDMDPWLTSGAAATPCRVATGTFSGSYCFREQDCLCSFQRACWQLREQRPTSWHNAQCLELPGLEQAAQVCGANVPGAKSCGRFPTAEATAAASCTANPCPRWNCCAMPSMRNSTFLFALTELMPQLCSADRNGAKDPLM